MIAYETSSNSTYPAGSCSASFCTSPAFAFPDVAVSSSTPVTVYMAGGEVSEGMMAGASNVGSAVSLSVPASASMTSSLWGSFEPISGPQIFDSMCGGIPGDPGNAGCGLFGQMDSAPPAALSSLDSTVIVNGNSCGLASQCFAGLQGLEGPEVDQATITGITNLDQIQVAMLASTGNVYAGYIWASYGGATGQFVVITY